MGNEYIIVLPGERTISWNKFYSGMHWTKRRIEANRVHLLVMAAVRDKYPNLSINGRVHITVTTYFNSRPVDPDNITAKFLIDGLVHAGVIADDTRKEVASVKTISEIDKINPRVEILLVEE